MENIDLMIKSVQDYVRRCLAPFSDRLKALEDRPVPKDGEPGKDADPAEVAALVQQDLAKSVPELVTGAVAKAVGELPKPKDGPTLEETLPALASMVKEQVEALPRSKDGEPGKNADPELVRQMVADAVKDLPTPKDGKDADPELVRAVVDAAVAALPKPENGKDADPEVVRQMVAEAVAEIPKPKDGKSITVEDMLPALESVIGKWALDFERRAQDVLQRAVDKFPTPKDGRDALDLDDLSVEHDGDGMVTFKFERGEQKKEFTIRLPRFKDRGVFRELEKYRQGDGVSFGGSIHIAQKDDPVGKPSESDDWRLAVKRGRDGRDAAPIEQRAAEPVRLK